MAFGTFHEMYPGHVFPIPLTGVKPISIVELAHNTVEEKYWDMYPFVDFLAISVSHWQR